MTATDDRVLEVLSKANPHPRESIAEASADPRAQAILADILSQPAPSRPVLHRAGVRPRTGWRVLAPVLSLLVVVAVVVVAIRAGTSRHPATNALGGATANEIVLRLQTTPEVPRITAAAVAQEIRILRARVRVLGAAPAHFTRAGDEIVVRSRELSNSPAARSLLVKDPQVTLTDWEQNVIAPDGRTVASLLLSGNHRAQILSQGHAGEAGAPDSGALSLYAAVKLASMQRARANALTQTRRGAQSFAFASAGSHTCSTASTPCMVSGPSATPAAASHNARRTGVTHPIVLTVPQGTIIVRASDSGAALRPDYRDAGARYFVLRDDAALTGLDLRRITAATDSGGQPAINATLTPTGERAFHVLTVAVAHRGAGLELGAAPFYQHFAVIINGALATVPIINYHIYPDGVVGSSSFQIDGGLSRARATALADELRLRTLPLRTTIAPRR